MRNRNISVVVYNRKCGSADVMCLAHKKNETLLTPPHYKVVAVVHGKLCESYACKWCDGVREQMLKYTVDVF